MSNTQDPIRSALERIAQIDARSPMTFEEKSARLEAAVGIAIATLQSAAAQPQDMREAFEAWARTEGRPHCIKIGAKMVDTFSIDSWKAWQAASTQGFTAHDMATAAADGFRDGVASTQASEPSVDATLLREFLAEAEKAGVTHLNEYGSTDLPHEIVGVSMTDGEKRLARLLMIALGIDHPAFDDFVALLMTKNFKTTRVIAWALPVSRQFSWEQQDERYWTPLVAAPARAVEPEGDK